MVVRAQRAAEPLEPESEEATEPVHHEHSHPEHHEPSNPEHHPGHDYSHMKDKFMNEIHHLPGEPTLGNKTYFDVLNYKCVSLVIFQKRESTPYTDVV